MLSQFPYELNIRGTIEDTCVIPEATIRNKLIAVVKPSILPDNGGMGNRCKLAPTLMH